VKRHGLNHQRVRFVQDDALTWPLPPGVFDLVVTHFFLDCFGHEELAGLITKVAAGATDKARWLLADFQVPDRGWRKSRAKVVLALLYLFFRFATGLSAGRLTPPGNLLRAAGFRLAGQRVGNFGLVHSDLWQRGNQ
jgi:hypothetical protein